MDNNDTAYLQDILDNIKILDGFLQGVSKEGFFADLEKQFAVARALEIMGEASGKLSEDFTNQHCRI